MFKGTKAYKFVSSLDKGIQLDHPEHKVQIMKDFGPYSTGSGET